MSEKDAVPDLDDNVITTCGIKNWWGWLVSVCTLLIIALTNGILCSFGVFYVKLQEEFDISDFKAGWVGALSFGVLFAFSPISTWLFKRFGHRKIIIIGVLMCATGLLLSSIMPDANYLFVTYSVLYGVGCNLVYNTAITLIGAYFPRKNGARATCLASLGWSLGSLIMNPVLQKLSQLVGWRHTLQIFGGVFLTFNLPLATVFRPAPERYEEGNDQKVFTVGREHNPKNYIKDFTRSLKTPGILLWFIGQICLCFSLFAPFVNMIKFMTTLGIPENRGTFVLSAIGVADLLGRSASAMFGNYIPFKTVYMYSIFPVVMGIALFSLLFASGITTMYIFAMVFGVSSGVVNGMLYNACINLFGVKVIAEAWTLTLLASGIGVMVGPPLSGAIFDLTGTFEISFMIGGAIFALSALVHAFIPCWQKLENYQPAKAQRSSQVCRPSTSYIKLDQRPYHSPIMRNCRIYEDDLTRYHDN